LGEIDAAKRVLEKAEKAYRSVSSLSQEEPDSVNRIELFRDLEALQQRLQAARNRLSGVSSPRLTHEPE
jgi:hypothetical protein